MRRIYFILVVALTACTPRGEIAFLENPDAVATQSRSFWSATLRPASDAVIEDGASAPPRPDAFAYEYHVVSIPPDREIGSFSLPQDGRADPERDFVSRSVTQLPSVTALRRDIAAQATDQEPILVFVHGYNVNHAEAVYAFAQFLEDYDAPLQPVLVSWPSAADARGYLYDRDSVAITRAHLERLIGDLRRTGRPVVLVGHSMGTLLVMETLRQMDIRAPGRVANSVDGVVLISPDIDPEVFREQFSHLRRVPSPFVVITSREDRALRLSSLLAGRAARLGTTTDPAALQDLPVTLIDLTEFSDDQALNHSTYATSPRAIAVLRALADSRFEDQPDVLIAAARADLPQ